MASCRICANCRMRRVRCDNRLHTPSGNAKAEPMGKGGLQLADELPGYRAGCTSSNYDRRRIVGDTAVARGLPVKGRILAIDDDRRLLENFSLCLEQDGHRVTCVDNL